MAEQRIFAPIAGRNDQGVMLDVGGGTTLPFTEDQLDKQGLMIAGNAVVYKPEVAPTGAPLPPADITITGKLGSESVRESQGTAPEGPVEPVAQPAVAQPQAVDQPVPQQVAPAQTTQVPAQEEPMALSPAEIPPENAPFIPGISAAQAAPAGGTGDMFGAIDSIVDSAIEFSRGQTAAGVEAALPEQAAEFADISPEEAGVPRPLILPRSATTDLPPDYYTRMFFTDIENPTAPEDPNFALTVHDYFRNATGYRKPVYVVDPNKPNQFARDADGNILVDEGEFALVPFESEDLDGRTREFIEGGGYALQLGETVANEDGTSNLRFPGDLLDAEVIQRASDNEFILNTPFYRNLTSEGGAKRIQEVMQANGLSLADQTYILRRLENAPVSAGKDLPRLTYTLDNGFGGLAQLAGLGVEATLDVGIFLTSWMMALGTDAPDIMDGVTKGLSEEFKTEMGDRIRNRRAQTKGNAIIDFAVNIGWDATERYADEHGLTYEQARAALMANRGFMETMNWFFMENLGFSGPVMAYRTMAGAKAAKSVDDWILESYGTDLDRRLYQQAATRTDWESPIKSQSRFDVVQSILEREQELDETFMENFAKAFSESKQFKSLSSYQQATADAYWMREGYLQQHSTLYPKIIELRGKRKEAQKAYNKLRTDKNASSADVNKARVDLFNLNKELAQAKAVAILPEKLQGLAKGEMSTALMAAAGYSWAYELSENPSTQDLATLFAVAAGVFPAVQGVTRDAGFALTSLLYTVPVIRQTMDGLGIAPPPKALYDAKKILTETADPQLAAMIQESLNSVATSISTAEEINRLAGRQVIDTSLYIQGLSAMSGLTRIDGAISGITANPKMGEVMQFKDEVRDITENSIQRITLRDQLAEAVLVLRSQIDGLPEGSANKLQNELNLMEDFVKRQDEIIKTELSSQFKLWDDFADQIEDVLLTGNNSKYLGTEIERLAREAEDSGNPLNIMSLVDALLEKDRLVAMGLDTTQIERLERVTTPLRQYLATTETGLQRINKIFDKALIQISELNYNQDEKVASLGVQWIAKQQAVIQDRFITLFNAFDKKYADHRLPMTTPFRFTNDKGEVIEAPSLLEYLENGDFYLAGTTESVARLVGGKQVDSSVAAIHGLMKESAQATLDNVRRNIPEAEEAFEDYINRLNATRIAAQQPPLDPTRMTELDRWRYMGEALVDFGVVENMNAWQTGMGRLGLKPKDYRVLVSHLGARGNTAKGFAQYSHHELRAQFLDRAVDFEANFFDVNLGVADAISGPEFKRDFSDLRSRYKTDSLDPIRNDPFVRNLLRDLEDGRLDRGPEFFENLTKRYRLDQDDANIEGFQQFWARFGGQRGPDGKYVINLDTPEGKQLQSLIETWGMSLVADTVAGKRALALRKNASQNVRAMAYTGEFAGDPTAGRQIAARTGFMVPDDVPDLEVAYQKDLPWQELTALENLKGVVTVDGKLVEVPLVNINRIVQPIMPESMEGGSLDSIYDLVKGTNSARKKAVTEAKSIVQQEIDLLNDVKTDIGREQDMLKSLFIDVGKGETPEVARRKLMELVAAGPGGAQRLARFKKTYTDAKLEEFSRNNPGATAAEVGEFQAQIDKAYKELLKNLAIDYLFESAARAGSSTILKAADGTFIEGNPAVLDGRVIFELLGLETRGGGISDRGMNFRQFFTDLGAESEFEQLKFLANNLFEAGPDGNIRIANLPTPINLNHVATRVVAGLRGQVSPRWLIIEHLLRQRSISAGKMFMTMMTDPEVGEALIELATKKDLSPKEIEGRIDILWRITKHAARTEWFEQNAIPALEQAEFNMQRATAPAAETED